MSLYRSLLIALTALVLTMPAFADDATQTNQPAAQTSETQAAAPAAANSIQQKLDINKATVKDLVKVKGINAAQAKAIVAYRKKNGDFKNLEELKNVKGFKKLNDEQMKEIQDQLTAG